MALQEKSYGQVSSVYGKGKDPGDKETVVDAKKQAATIHRCADKIVKLQNERKALNQEITSLMTEVEAVGITKRAFKAALKRYQLEEADRNEHDEHLAIACRALGCEMQLSMFEGSASVQ